MSNFGPMTAPPGPTVAPPTVMPSFGPIPYAAVPQPVPSAYAPSQAQGYGAPIPLTPVIMPNSDVLLAQEESSGGLLSTPIFKKLLALPVIAVIAVSVVAIVAVAVVFGKLAVVILPILFPNFSRRVFGITPAPVESTTPFPFEQATPFDYAPSFNSTYATNSPYGQRKRREAADNSSSGMPSMSIAQVDRITQVVFAALRSQECNQRLLCEAGSLARSFSDTAHSVAKSVEQYVPDSLKNSYDIFTRADKCEQYICGALNVRKMGMFFSPGLPAINIVKLFLLLYIRSWAVLTCNVPHEVIFRASRSNNFYLWLLLIMLFLCTLPVAYAIVWLEPSWHCGPFSDYARMFHVMTQSIIKATPESLHWVLSYIASPGVVIPLLVLLILVIYYLVSLSSSLREAVTDLRTQLRRERDAERLKTRQKKEAMAAAEAEEQQQPKTESDGKVGQIISQWRKSAPITPKAQQQQLILSQTRAKEAVEKHFSQSGRKHQHHEQQRQQQCAGSSPPKKRPSPPPVAARNQQQQQQQQPPVVRDREAVGEDGSDLDISDSLPFDVAPALPSQPVKPKQQQPVYAVVKKKKTTTTPAGVAAKTMADHSPVPIAPRSPKIPLIRISQTESVDRAEKMPSSGTGDISSQQDNCNPVGLVAASPTKSCGALGLILQQAKDRRAAAAASSDAKVPASESTTELMLNMEDTATVDRPILESVESTSDPGTPTLTENAD